jgi:glycosyltransferase involved in cell wall biosynthesis
VTRIAILCNESAGQINAIRDHTFRLAEAVRSKDVTADVFLRRRDGSWSQSGREQDRPVARVNHSFVDATAYDAVVLQYNPFMYGRWGFAPWLAVELRKSRRRQGRGQIALMVHEPYVPMTNCKWALMGAWQRAQLEVARVSADVVFASIESWTRMLRARRPFRPTIHLPVGSNLPDRRDERTATRASLHVSHDEVVLACFGGGEGSRLVGHVVAAANRLVGMTERVLLLNLGAGASPLPGLSRQVRVYAPGRVAEADLASSLAAADLFLAAFVDGVSTRRGSLMAALQHELPVVGTQGPLTDAVLGRARDALALVPVGPPDRFASCAAVLAKKPEERLAMGIAGRALYQSSFDWPVLADRLLYSLT